MFFDKKYGCVIIGDNSNNPLKNVFEKVADGGVNTMEAKGMIIAFFRTSFLMNELKDYFDSIKMNVLLFELDDNTSFIRFVSEKAIRMLDLGDDIENIPKRKNKNTTSKTLTVEDVENMGFIEKNDLLNTYIEIGFDKLSEEDKKIVELLTK